MQGWHHLVLAQIFSHGAPQESLIDFRIGGFLHARVALKLCESDRMEREQLLLQLCHVHGPQSEIVGLHLQHS